jgi:hypothetical protein
VVLVPRGGIALTRQAHEIAKQFLRDFQAVPAIVPSAHPLPIPIGQKSRQAIDLMLMQHDNRPAPFAVAYRCS